MNVKTTKEVNLMLLAIKNELRKVATYSPVLRNRVASEKIYEIYILSCLLQALRSLGATLIPKDNSHQKTTNLIFRLAPGKLNTSSSNPGYIHVQYKGNDYEVQNGLRVAGTSKVLHEFDICIIKKESANNCRKKGNDPISSNVVFMCECKYYHNRLDLSLGREMIGLAKDCSVKIKTFVSNISDDKIHTLITKHNVKENFNICPSNKKLTDQFTKWLAGELKQVLA